MNHISTEQITGVVIAGGQGRRMGGMDKGLMLFQQAPLIEHLLAALQPQVSRIIINANRNQAQYQQYGYPIVNDELSDYQGPLAGFAASMQAASTPYILTLPCDAPFLSQDYAKRLFSPCITDQARIAVAHDGERLQPMHALLHVALLPSLQAFLARGERKIDYWYAEHTMHSVDFSDQTFMFQNINTPEQYKAMTQQDLSL